MPTETQSKVNSKELLSVLNELSKKIEKDIADKKENVFVFNPEKKIEYGPKIWGEIELRKQEILRMGFDVEVRESIDKVNVTNGPKFMIRIEDNNGSYYEIDYFKYRDICLDYNANEVLFISECLEKLVGNKTEFDAELPELIVSYLSYACHFKQVQTKTYNIIGWASYNEEIIFKYDSIYSNSKLVGKCTAEYGTALYPEEPSVIDKETWLDINVYLKRDKTDHIKRDICYHK